MHVPLSRLVAVFALSMCVAASAFAADPLVVPLWANGAPGFEARKNEPEKIVQKSGAVTNVHNPSLTVFLPPKDQATGAAVIVAPGGGHRFHSIDSEGMNVGRWLAAHGIAGFVLKYRLGRDEANPPGTEQPYAYDVHGLADMQRALRLVRARAKEWGVNPAAVGGLGFSAGGELVALASMRSEGGRPDAADAIDRESGRPDFQALIYPGKSGQIVPAKGAPPAFLLAGYKDRPDISEGLAKVYLLFKAVEVPAELHLYASAGHGFGYRENQKAPWGAWPERFREWLVDQKFIGAPAAPAPALTR